MNNEPSSPIIGDYSLGGNRFVVYALRVSEAWATRVPRTQPTSSPIIGDYSLGGNRFVVYALRVSEAWRIHYELDAFFIVAVGAVRERPLHV